MAWSFVKKIMDLAVRGEARAAKQSRQQGFGLTSPESPITIEHNSNLKCSIHLESGLGVKWIRDDPPMERRLFFALIVDGHEFPFEASYESGHEKIAAAHPDLSIIEQAKLVMALREKSYYASSIKAKFDKRIFVAVWRNLVSQRYSRTRVSTYYIENSGTVDRKVWSSEG